MGERQAQLHRELPRPKLSQLPTNHVAVSADGGTPFHPTIASPVFTTTCRLQKVAKQHMSMDCPNGKRHGSGKTEVAVFALGW